jgi:bacterioferritin (cytochrome b1)
MLVSQLNVLLRLTNTEVMIAQARRAQATSEDIERELSANADKCNERIRMISDAVRDLGGAPDLVRATVGRAGTLAKLATEQGQPLEEALLSDLLLEQDLLDRARFAKMLAEQADVPARITRVLDRLEVAHSATVDWLMQRLAEVAVGGPPALRPSPMQSAVAVGRSLTWLPARRATTTINRSIVSARRLRERAGESVGTNVERTRQLVSAASEIWTAGRDASMQRGEQIASERGDSDLAARINRTRRDAGAVEASELPIRGYESKGVPEVVSAVERLRDPEQVRTVLAYEEANKRRKGVTQAARNRIEVLAASLVAAS